MNGTIEVALRRTGSRGRAAVDRLERFPAEFAVTVHTLRFCWTGTGGQRNDLECPLSPELRRTLIEVLRSENGAGGE